MYSCLGFGKSDSWQESRGRSAVCIQQRIQQPNNRAKSIQQNGRVLRWVDRRWKYRIPGERLLEQNPFLPLVSAFGSAADLPQYLDNPSRYELEVE
eukprot:6124049-Pyramimonas_sp.AAC.3